MKLRAGRNSDWKPKVIPHADQRPPIDPFTLRVGDVLAANHGLEVHHHWCRVVRFDFSGGVVLQHCRRDGSTTADDATFRLRRAMIEAGHAGWRPMTEPAP